MPRRVVPVRWDLGTRGLQVGAYLWESAVDLAECWSSGLLLMLLRPYPGH